MSFFYGDIVSEELQSNSAIKIKEIASVSGGITGFGQLWVKNTTPNQLYFTTDSGNDIQITSGTSLVQPDGLILTGSTDNTICTVSGSNAILGEANLTFNSTSGILKIGDSGTANGIIKMSQQNGGKILLTHNDNGSRISHTITGSKINIEAGELNNNTGKIRLRTASSGESNHVTKLIVLQSGNVGILTGSPTEKLHVEGNISCKELEFLHEFITDSSSSDIDLSNQNTSITLFVDQQLLQDTIQLPEATTARIGMIITIIMITNATTFFQLSPSEPRIAVPHDSGNGTKIDGVIYLNSEDNADRSNDVLNFADKKAIFLDSNNEIRAGGATGSIYTFYYIAENKIFAICKGIVTTTSSSEITVAIDEFNATSSTGF